MADLNALNLRDEVYDDAIPEELPEQGGGYIPQPTPGIYSLRLPYNLAQLWEAFDVEEKDASGNATGKTRQRLRIRFDRDNPLVIVGGEHDGEPLTGTISNVPRKRSKRDDVPAVSDMQYLLRESLNDPTKCTTPKQWVAAVNKHAGETIRVEVGWQGQCRDDKVRYIESETGDPIEDPEGNMGCGKRYYTKAFKQSDEQNQTYWAERILCESCGASIRGFAQIDRFLKPATA